MASKKAADTAAQKEFAHALYMNNTSQGEIAEKVNVSRQTVNKWIKDGGWAERRAAKNITRPELANRLLAAIADEIDRLNERPDLNEAADGDEQSAMTPEAIKLRTKIAALEERSRKASIDQLTRMSAIVERLDKKASVVDAIEVFIAFGKWIQYRASIDPELTPELIKAINKYQDLYISELLGDKFKN